MFSWQKLGKVFDPTDHPGKPWRKEFAQAPATLIYKDFVRVFFACRPAPDANGQYVSYTGYVDLDRSSLKRVIAVAQEPIFPLGGLGTFDEFGTYPTSVVRHGRKVLAYYAGWSRCQSVPFNVSIGMAISHDDGNTFEKTGTGPVLSFDPFEPLLIAGPKIRRFQDQFYLWYLSGKKWMPNNGKPEQVHKIRMATSQDGLEWQRFGTDILPDKLEPNECQASPDVVFYKGYYHMFFCYRYSTGYRGHERGYRIGYAYSQDLFHWTRDDEKAGIDVSTEGWDSEMISYPHVFELDGSLYMFYLGNHVGKFGFGLAKLVNHI